MAEVDEPFPQNDEAAKRFKGGQKRKQPAATNTNSTASPPSNAQAGPVSPNAIGSLKASNPPSQSRATTSGMVYQQPKSLQHHPLPSHPLQLDQSIFDSENFRQYRNSSISSSTTNGDRNGSISGETRLADQPTNGVDFAQRHATNSSLDTRGSSFLDYPAATPKTVNVVDHSSAEDLEAVTSMLAETTLSNVAYYGPSAAAVASVFNDEDLWGPQLGAASTEGDVLVPEEMQVLPDLATREYLIALYYKNHYFSLPMVQREVLRVCQENIHIPHCLLLCNAVFYCGSMFSSNTLSLRKDRNDEGTVGEDFFMRGQVLLEKKYLTAHLCTIQALLLFAIGHKSPAQRSAFISQAITMALDMGLHTRLDSSAHPFVRAYRARVFWCCYLFDSTASAINGKPALINDEEISIDMFQAGDLGPDTETFSDQYIIHCLHGWQICRRIRKNSKLIVRQPPPPRSILLDNLARLDNELVEWQENLPKAFDFLPVDGCIISDISSLAACAQLLCYALIILLHHPYLPNPKSKEAFQPSAPGLPDSQGYCTQAAKEITKIAGILLKEAPRTFEQNTPSRYALNFAIRIHLRNSKCLVDPTLAKESRRDLQRTMDYIERVEDLQFFRINRSKKSDMTDLLASCRAALAQQKSSLDLAKEAAALKHRQMLQEKEALKAKQRLLQEQQQQRQQQQQQAHEKAIQQPVLASQNVPTQQQKHQLDERSQNAPLSPSQIVLSMQATQQHPNIQQQSYKQHQLHLQMYTQEHSQQELARLNQLQRQGQLDMDHQRHQHFQQLAMAKHKQHIFMQHQQFNHPHVYRQQPSVSQQHSTLAHNHQPMQPSRQQQQQQQQTQRNMQPFPTQQMLQNSTLFQGQSPPNYASPLGMNNSNSNTGSGSNGSSLSFPLLDIQDPSAFANLSQEQQQQLFVAFSQSLNSNSNVYYPTGPSFQQRPGSGSIAGGQGNVQGQEQPMTDFGDMMINNQQQMLFSSAASSSALSQGGGSGVAPTSSSTRSSTLTSSGLLDDVFLNPNTDTTINARSMSSHPRMGQQVFNRMPSPTSTVQPQTQQQRQQGYNHNNFANGANNLSSTNSYAYSNSSASGRLGSPESVASPGGSISEESILQSWSISTLHDNIYLNPNLARDDPRNDLGTFMYLPSEFEYGDAPALSPAASSVNGGNGSIGAGGGSEGGASPRNMP